MKTNKSNVPNMVSEFQCCGCVSDGESCYSAESPEQMRCKNHVPGTHLMGIGKILLGFPKGFNRVGETLPISIELFEQYPVYYYNELNIPVWVYQHKGYTFVRGIHPRINKTFIHVINAECENCFTCFKVTEEFLKGID